MRISIYPPQQFRGIILLCLTLHLLTKRTGRNVNVTTGIINFCLEIYLFFLSVLALHTSLIFKKRDYIGDLFFTKSEKIDGQSIIIEKNAKNLF